MSNICKRPVTPKGQKRRRKREAARAVDPLIAAAKAKGTDPEFLEWVRKQPSVISGEYSEWLPDIGEWRNPACHVRRVANGSGTATKPPYSAVPMTHEEHDIQTRLGEAALLNWADQASSPRIAPWTEEEAKACFGEMAEETLRRWIES